VILPKLGLTMDEGRIVAWRKREGDRVAAGEILFEVETDKATMEVESPAAGMLRRILFAADAVAPVATVIALIAATITMQLVLARSAGGQDTPASRVFDPGQIEVLRALQKKLQGRTRKQQNPHPPDSLAWAGWTIARLGGWTGYHSDKSTGPITMRDGLERFYGIVDGYNLAKNVCPS